MAIKHPKTQVRRAELLKAAREVFAEKGFEATTVSEIVSRAGVAQGTFYLYFPSKISVAKALADEMRGEIEQALHVIFAQATTPAEIIDRSVEAAFRILGEYSDVLALTHSGVRWLGEETTDSPIRDRPTDPQGKGKEQAQTGKISSSFFTRYHGLIAQAIRSDQATGAVPTEIDPDVTATFIVGMIYYSADQCYVYHMASPEVYIKEAAHFIRWALGLR